MSNENPPGGIGVDLHYTAERVQAEMNVIGQNYLRMMAITVVIYYGLRSLGYFLKFPPEIAPQLAAGTLITALLGGAVYLRCRRAQMSPLKIELSTLLLGSLVIFNVFWNMYLTDNKNQFFSAGLAIIVFGISTTQLRLWLTLVVLNVTTYVVAAIFMPVIGVEVVSLMVACLLISVAAFFTRAPAIRNRVELQLQLEDKAKSLESAMKAKDRFLANMTHELRTPMTGVLGMMDLMRDTKLTHEQDQLLKTAKTSAGYLLAIINDILDYSKLESGKFELNVGAMDAIAMTRDVAGMLRSQAEAKGISVTVHTPQQKDLWVMGDSVRLGQILFNLLGNAIKFTDKGAADIYLDIVEEPTVVQLIWRVCDTGSGIPEERIETLFERFEQLGDDATRRQTGTGLGLAIIKELVALMEGDIVVESTVGEGSEFRVTVTLPRAQRVLKEASVATAIEGTGPMGHLKVLVAEDNIVNQVLIRKLMERKGWDVTVVDNGETAVAEATKAEGAFDLVLMDVRMPIMDGPTATKLIKQKLKTPPPVIALTANTLTKDVESYLAAGMDAHVGKPIVIQELMEKISSVLKLTPGENGH